MRPVTIVTTIAGVEIRPNPRTAWMRSSSPGPANTTRASRTTPPTHTDIARACSDAHQRRRGQRRSPTVREMPMVAAARPGMPSARELRGRVDCPIGSECHPGRGDQQHEAEEYGATGPTGVDEVEPGSRTERSTTSVGGDRRRRERDVEQRADHCNDPHGTQEPDRDQVFDALGPCGGDDEQRAEQDGDAERRDETPEPDRCVAAPRDREIDHDGIVLDRRHGRAVGIDRRGRGGRGRRGGIRVAPATGVVAASGVAVVSGVASRPPVRRRRSCRWWQRALSTMKVMMPRPLGSPSVLLTAQRAVHVPAGSGRSISTWSVVPSTTSGVGSWTGLSQSSAIVFGSPSSSAKTMTITSGRHGQRGAAVGRRVDDGVLGSSGPGRETEERR